MIDIINYALAAFSYALDRLRNIAMRTATGANRSVGCLVNRLPCDAVTVVEKYVLIYPISPGRVLIGATILFIGTLAFTGFYIEPNFGVHDQELLPGVHVVAPNVIVPNWPFHFRLIVTDEALVTTLANGDAPRITHHPSSIVVDTYVDDELDKRSNQGGYAAYYVAELCNSANSITDTFRFAVTLPCTDVITGSLLVAPAIAHVTMQSAERALLEPITLTVTLSQTNPISPAMTSVFTITLPITSSQKTASFDVHVLRLPFLLPRWMIEPLSSGIRWMWKVLLGVLVLVIVVVILGGRSLFERAIEKIGLKFP